MQNRDDRRYGQGADEPSNRQEGWWRNEDREVGSHRGEQRSFEPNAGDERGYGRQGQRGGNAWGGGRSGAEPSTTAVPHAARYTAEDGGYDYRAYQGEPSYGQSGSDPARRSEFRRNQRYGDSGWATGEGGYNTPEAPYGAQGGGYSGYGSSGQGQYGDGGYWRGGQDRSGNGDNFGQGQRGYGGYGGTDLHGQGQGGASSSAGRSGYGEGGYGQAGGYGQYADRDRGGGREGVYGEGAGRSRLQPYGGGGREQAQQHEEFEPDYLEWRRNQLSAYDRDYHHWRENQARAHDEEYRTWRQSRRDRFHQDFHSWRSGGSGPDRSSQGAGLGGQDPLRSSPVSASTSGVSYTGQSAGGGATSGFATHEVSGVLNADLSGDTSSGKAPAVGLTGGGASAGATGTSAGSGGGRGMSGRRSGPGGGDVLNAPLQAQTDEHVRKVTDTGDSRIERDEDRRETD